MPTSSIVDIKSESYEHRYQRTLANLNQDVDLFNSIKESLKPYFRKYMRTDKVDTLIDVMRIINFIKLDTFSSHISLLAIYRLIIEGRYKDNDDVPTDVIQKEAKLLPDVSKDLLDECSEKIGADPLSKEEIDKIVMSMAKEAKLHDNVICIIGNRILVDLRSEGMS